MFTALAPGAIGVSVSTLEERIAAAKIGGFDGVEIDPAEILRRGGAACKELLDTAKVRAAGWGIPFNWQGPEEAWSAGVKAFGPLVKACAEIDCVRVSTWIMPASNELEFEENYRFHATRLKPIADLLGEFGGSLGLEYIGPKTLRDQFKFPFIWTAQGMLELGQDTAPNVGLLVDCWHWYTSGGTVEELKKLSVHHIVYVHINDAPKGVPVDQQVDNVRCLPLETGVIDLAGFLSAIKSTGYDGPVVPEPFKDELYALASDEDRLKALAGPMAAVKGLL